jgi:hypothetical protein
MRWKIVGTMCALVTWYLSINSSIDSGTNLFIRTIV